MKRWQWLTHLPFGGAPSMGDQDAKSGERRDSGNAAIAVESTEMWKTAQHAEQLARHSRAAEQELRELCESMQVEIREAAGEGKHELAIFAVRLESLERHTEDVASTHKESLAGLASEFYSAREGSRNQSEAVLRRVEKLEQRLRHLLREGGSPAAEVGRMTEEVDQLRESYRNLHAKIAELRAQLMDLQEAARIPGSAARFGQNPRALGDRRLADGLQGESVAGRGGLRSSTQETGSRGSADGAAEATTSPPPSPRPDSPHPPSERTARALEDEGSVGVGLSQLQRLRSQIVPQTGDSKSHPEDSPPNPEKA